MKHKSSIALELEEEDLLVKLKRNKLSRSIVQSQQVVEVSNMENGGPDGLPVEVSAAKDPTDELTDYVMQSSGVENGCSEGHVHSISSAGNECAGKKLPKICTAAGWKEPSYDFEEQGPPHKKLFRCKVTVHVDGLVDTVVECFSDLKDKKIAAQEHAAQGAIWCLQRFEHVK